jgi:hypothetical protein
VTLLAVAVVACALTLLPAAVGVTILIGSTLPLEFAAAACLTLLAAIKLAAAVAGLVAATSHRIRTSHLSRSLALAAQRR